MKSYRIIHQVLFVLAFVPMLLNLGPWYVTILLPLALIVPYGINEMIITRKERSVAARHSPPPMQAPSSMPIGSLSQQICGKGRALRDPIRGAARPGWLLILNIFRIMEA